MVKSLVTILLPLATNYWEDQPYPGATVTLHLNSYIEDLKKLLQPTSASIKDGLR